MTFPSVQFQRIVSSGPGLFADARETAASAIGAILLRDRARSVARASETIRLNRDFTRTCSVALQSRTQHRTRRTPLIVYTPSAQSPNKCRSPPPHVGHSTTSASRKRADSGVQETNAQPIFTPKLVDFQPPVPLARAQAVACHGDKYPARCAPRLGHGIGHVGAPEYSQFLAFGDLGGLANFSSASVVY